MPADLTRATPRYKRHAWLAVLGLLSFVVLYVALTGWFCFTSARLFQDMLRGGSRYGFFDFLGGAVSGLLGAFLLSALFFIKSGGKPSDLEVTAAEEPALFEFLNALADRAGAQRPHRVFLSMRVNAAVFYDLSLANLLFPSKKNLEIGLALVNTLNLSEMTAVLAHEFGHFAQRSMAVGRWVYMAQQITGQIVASRGWLDKTLGALSSVDLRVAWIGWVMRIVVWSIRSLLDTAFGLVILAQRALGREMEFQADLVSVSLTGSDALVHALYRLGAADGAWSNALSIASAEAARGRAVPDLFALQTRIIERMAGILNEPGHGASPAVPSQGREQHRVFELELAEPPRMWSTHPANRDREDNAKRVYVASELDPRPAFALFADAEGLRRKATARLLADGVEKPLEPLSPEAALGAVDKRFDRPHLQQRYRGVYLGRSVVLHEKAPQALYGDAPPSLREALLGLYPESLANDLRDLRTRQEERSSLEALRDGLLDAPGGVIRHRGQIIQRRSLAAVLSQVTSETETVRARVEAHDRACRSSHLAAARALGYGWHEYLSGMIALHHYAAHAEADLEDARGHLANVFAIVTADGSVSASERRRLVTASSEVHLALTWIFDNKDAVELPDVVIERLMELRGISDEKKLERWPDILPGKFLLPLPSEANIGDFLGAIDSWVNAALAALGALERVSLELLVEAEAHVARCYLEQTEVGVSPEPPTVPERYATLLRGQERSRQKRLGWWDRFQTADGFLPSAARLVVAGGILAGVLGFGGSIGHPTLTILNALGRTVVVEVGTEVVSLEPGHHRELSLERAPQAKLRAKTLTGDVIESREVELQGSAHYVYNVAGATTLVEWTAVYGKASPVPERQLGALTWFESQASVLFEDPPRTLSTQSGSGTRKVLSAALDAPPQRVLRLAQAQGERARLLEAHVLWDTEESRFLADWLKLAGEYDTAVIERRLARNPTDVPALREEQDRLSGAAKDDLCRSLHARAEQSPQNVDLRYLDWRCSANDEAEAGQLALEQHRAQPNHPYFALAAARQLYLHGDYREAVTAYQAAAQLRMLRESANLAQARILRLIEPSWLGPVRALATESSELQMLLTLEMSDDVEGAEHAFALLDRGKLDEAVAAARSAPDLLPVVLRLAAASEGASHDLIDEALLLHAEPTVVTVWPSIALAEREHRPHEELTAFAERSTPAAKELLRFTSAELLEGDRTQLEAALKHLPGELSVYGCVAALVREAERAPSDCRKLVKATLFSAERPFFR
ncbi:MAG TPA: M48 family metalloprotease [Polyangiaceae bacterium]|nr:M48 family metalloprotease [Polyangiaceae bacterium]